MKRWQRLRHRISAGRPCDETEHNWNYRYTEWFADGEIKNVIITKNCPKCKALVDNITIKEYTNHKFNNHVEQVHNLKQ